MQGRAWTPGQAHSSKGVRAGGQNAVSVRALQGRDRAGTRGRGYYRQSGPAGWLRTKRIWSLGDGNPPDYFAMCFRLPALFWNLLLEGVQASASSPVSRVHKDTHFMALSRGLMEVTRMTSLANSQC